MFSSLPLTVSFTSRSYRTAVALAERDGRRLPRLCCASSPRWRSIASALRLSVLAARAPSRNVWSGSSACALVAESTAARATSRRALPIVIFIIRTTSHEHIAIAIPARGRRAARHQLAAINGVALARSPRRPGGADAAVPAGWHAPAHWREARPSRRRPGHRCTGVTRLLAVASRGREESLGTRHRSCDEG